MARNLLKFDITPSVDSSLNRTPVVTPWIDGVSLIEAVTRFEQRRRFDPAGDYTGLSLHDLVPDPTNHYLGRAASLSPATAPAWVLGCSCGEAGCWPLEAGIGVDDDEVTWSDFRQPHRPGWDYTGFGPLRFDRTAYEREVSVVAEGLARWQARSTD